MSKGRNRKKPNTHLQEKLTALGLGDRVSLETLLADVSRLRGRPVEVRTLDTLGADDGLCGMWFATSRADVIFHANVPSSLHVQQIVLHEISHILLDHNSVAIPTAKIDDPEFESLTAFAREDFTEDIEIEAEQFADLLADAIRNSTVEPAGFQKIFG